MEQLNGSPFGAASTPPVETRPFAIMPALALATESYHHTLHSALATLEALGVSTNRISLLRAGRQAHVAGTVVRQVPAAGTPLLPDTIVQLHIAGLGLSHALPVGLWDSGGETHAGTREVLECFDDPLDKLAHWFHEGAPLFRIAPDNLPACARWLHLFGVDADRWPRRLWYPLASVIANMAQLSCSQDGIAFVLRALLGLPVKEFRFQPMLSTLPASALSRLGASASRLGVDLVVGDAAEDLAALEIHLGPVSIETYEHFQEKPEGADLLKQTLKMVMPTATDYLLHWSVLDERQAPRLGVRGGNSRLGINTHMGRELGGVKPLHAEPAASHQPTQHPQAGVPS